MSARADTLWRTRPMANTDLPWVLDIEQRAYQYPWTASIFRDCLRVGYSSWVVTGAEGDVQAYALMSIGPGEAHILNLCVDPPFQRAGLARYLLRHLKHVARAARAELLLLEVRQSNRAAIALYLSSDFRRLGERKQYYPAAGGRENAWLLGCDLLDGA